MNTAERPHDQPLYTRFEARMCGILQGPGANISNTEAGYMTATDFSSPAPTFRTCKRGADHT